MTSPEKSPETGPQNADPRVLVLIPTYNERENLPLIVARLQSAVPSAEMLIIDDGSPDGTGEVADELAAAHPGISVMHRTEKAGLGAAYIAGFRWGLDAGYDVLVEMDADGSHPPEHLPRLLGALDHADLVIGSRYVRGGSVVNWPRRREILSKGGNLYCRLVLGVKVRDITAGFRAYKSQVLRSLDLDAVESHGYCFQVDLGWRTIQAGYRVTEVPITFTERAIGTSKMSGSIVKEALLKVTVWGIKHRIQQIKGLFGGKKPAGRTANS